MANAVSTWEEYRETRFFSPLDGVRAISVILVIIWHMPEHGFWDRLNGYAGVTAFFVLSGFLITTLALREASRTDRFSLRAFYIRRVFRIVPLYALVLCVYVALTASGLYPNWAEFRSTLIYFVTFSVDFIHERHVPFQPAWSLGIEEKFYVLWPLAMVVSLRLTSRARIGAGLLLVLLVLVLKYGVADYFGLYSAISVGCATAFLLDDPWCYERIRRVMAVNFVPVLVVLAAVAMHLAFEQLPGGAGAYPLFVAAAVVAILLRPASPVSLGLASPLAQWIGRRSYGIYLVHSLVIFFVGDILVSPDSAPAITALRFALAVVISFALAEVLYRTVEAPMIRRGHKVAARAKRSTEPANPEPAPTSGR